MVFNTTEGRASKTPIFGGEVGAIPLRHSWYNPSQTRKYKSMIVNTQPKTVKKMPVLKKKEETPEIEIHDIWDPLLDIPSIECNEWCDTYRDMWSDYVCEHERPKDMACDPPRQLTRQLGKSNLLDEIDNVFDFCPTRCFLLGFTWSDMDTTAKEYVRAQLEKYPSMKIDVCLDLNGTYIYDYNF